MSKTAAALFLLVPTLLVGVLLYFVVGGPSSASTEESWARSSELQDLRARIESIESKLGTLTRTGAAFETIEGENGTRTVAGGPPSELRDFQLESRLEKIEKALERAATPGLPTEDALAALANFDPPKEKIRKVLDEVREEEKRAEEEKRRQEEEDRIRARLEESADRLQINDAQINEMTRILADESVARRALFSDRMGGPGGPGGFDGMREKMEAITQTRNEQLGQILQPWQIEEYDKIQQEQRRGFFGGDRRGGGDRGGDRGGRGGRGGAPPGGGG